jgi:hypothetical protein
MIRVTRASWPPAQGEDMDELSRGARPGSPDSAFAEMGQIGPIGHIGPMGAHPCSELFCVLKI